MIYITGDTHIPTDVGKLSAKRFAEQKNLTQDDYVIICGDFCGGKAHMLISRLMKNTLLYLIR